MERAEFKYAFPANAAAELVAMGATGYRDVLWIDDRIYGVCITHSKICPFKGNFDDIDEASLNQAIGLLVGEMKRIVGTNAPVTAVHPNVYGSLPPLKEALLTEPTTGVTIPIWEFDLVSGKRLLAALAWGARVAFEPGERKP